MPVILTLEISLTPFEFILTMRCGGSVRLQTLTAQSVEPAVIRHPSVICTPVSFFLWSVE